MPVLTRKELYDLVWSMPVLKVAESFGLSDVGLAKICERHRVPVPPRGYWAKKESGKKVKQAVFTEADDPLLDRIQIASMKSALPEPVREIIERNRTQRKAAQSERSDLMKAPQVDPVDDPHPAVKATVAVLRRSKPSKSGVVQAVGSGLCGITIGGGSVERVVYILDHLAGACEARGISVKPAETCMNATIGQDTVTFQVLEKTKQVPHVLTDAEIAAEEKRRKRWSQSRNPWDDLDFSPGPPKFDSVRTGELWLEIRGWESGLRRSWRDGKTQVLETLIDQIVDGLEARIVADRCRREAHERAEAERQELERRRALARARNERERLRKSLLMKLITSERKATQIREWIAASKCYLAEHRDADLDRMTSWATRQLEELEGFLDPARLSADIRTSNLFPEMDDLHDPLGEPPEVRSWYDRSFGGP